MFYFVPASVSIRMTTSVWVLVLNYFKLVCNLIQLASALDCQM